MNLNQIELLHLLQSTDFNLTKSAEKMHVVQSAVSRQLQMLETELGAPLFERQGKRLLGLTPLGEQVIAQARVIKQATLNIQSIADDFRDNRHGILHIATTHAQAKYLLPEPIRRFRERYPQIKIFIAQSSPNTLIDLLHQNKADIAICTERLDEDDTLELLPCYQWHHLALVQQGHPLATGELSLARLMAYPILTYSQGFTGRSNIEKAFNQAGFELDVTLAAADSDIIKTYVRLGLGVGIITETCYEPDKDADLVPLDLQGLIPSAVTKIAYLKQHYLPSYLRYFIDELLLAGQARRSPD